MIRATTDTLSAAAIGRSLVSTPARATEAASPASWFDAAAVDADTRISADLNLASRGLSVEQHASRVLAHLCGGREDSA